VTGYGFHPQALGDLDEIWEFIAADNVDAADRVVAEVFSALGALLPFPDSGFRRPELTSRPLRFLLAREYLVAYAPEASQLWFVAIMHGR
jgi:plasmid stabilization system protein ParE